MLYRLAMSQLSAFLVFDPQSAKLAKEYGLPEPAAGIAHPVRTRKRAAGLEPASRRQRTRLPEAAGAPEQADDVVYIGEPLSQSSPALSILSSLLKPGSFQA